MSAMPEGKVEQLAIHVATGGTVKEWAKDNNIVLRTAYRWYAHQRFKARVESIRERIVNATVGRLVQGSTAASVILWKIMSDEETPAAVRVTAANSILKNMQDVRMHQALAARLEALEQAEKDRDTKRKGKGK